jgi:hypothetical protein
MTSYFERIDARRYQPTEHAGGAWNATEIHFSPLGGLVVHAMDAHRAAEGSGTKQLGRISFDILGFLAAEVCEIDVVTLRAGRTIELVQATVTIQGRAAVIARAWFLSESDSSAVAGGAPTPIAPPDDIPQTPLSETWAGGYVASLDLRYLQPPEPGRTTAWISTAIELVAGEPSTTHASFVALVDTANGIAVRESPKEWMFPNIDLTIHLYRPPVSRWVGFDTSVIFGRTGLGTTSTVLHDTEGAVGHAEQILTVRRL